MTLLAEHSTLDPVGTLAERIHWILEHRGISGRELARRAGLSPSAIGVFFTTTKKNPATTLSAPSAVGIAEAGEVDLDWLITGRGTPEGRALRPLRALAGWPDARRLAEHLLPPGVPAHFLDDAGEATVPGRRPSAALLARLAEALFLTAAHEEPAPSRARPVTVPPPEEEQEAERTHVTARPVPRRRLG